MIDKIRKNWPEWEVDSKLGSGSYGAVYKIKRTDDWNSTFYSALKVVSFPKQEEEIDTLREQGMDEESITEHYQRYAENLYKEIKLLESLKGHSNIVSYEGHKTIRHENGVGYDFHIKMELLTPLNKMIQKENLNEQEIVKVGIDICKALELCNKKGILHRDIKPANIFVSGYGDYKLGDFGVARVAETSTMGTMTGTYSYIAPEIFHRGRYDARVDIYSLGLVLYQLLNHNRLPFTPPATQKLTAEDMANAYQMRVSGKPLPMIPHVSMELNRIILKACEYKAENRYKDASEFKKDLENYVAGNTFEQDYYEDTYKLDATEVLDRNKTVGTLPFDYVEKSKVVEKPVTVKKAKNGKMIIVAGAILAVVIVVVLIFAGQGTDSGKTNDEESVGIDYSSLEDESTENSNGDLGGTVDDIVITAGVDYILPGDKVEFYCNAGDLIMESADGLTWTTSDSSIATITDNGIFEAVSPGKVELIASYDGAEAVREVTVLEIDESMAEEMLSVNYDSVTLATRESENVEITVSSELPEQLNIYCYHDCGPQFNTEWIEFIDGTAKLNVTNLFGTPEGTLTVYVTPEGEPENVCGVARIKIYSE